MSNYIYKMFNKNDEIIYIGKTLNLKERIKQHKQEKDWFCEVSIIYYAVCESKTDMDIYEIYYINKCNPKYNLLNAHKEKFKYELPELRFIEYKKNQLPINTIFNVEEISYAEVNFMTPSLNDKFIEIFEDYILNNTNFEVFKIFYDEQFNFKYIINNNVYNIPSYTDYFIETDDTFEVCFSNIFGETCLISIFEFYKYILNYLPDL